MSNDNWLLDEFYRAQTRAMSVPEWARPVVTRGSFASKTTQEKTVTRWIDSLDLKRAKEIEPHRRLPLALHYLAFANHLNSDLNLGDPYAYSISHTMDDRIAQASALIVVERRRMFKESKWRAGRLEPHSEPSLVFAIELLAVIIRWIDEGRSTLAISEFRRAEAHLRELWKASR